MTAETALQLTIAAIALATIGLIVSEVRGNLIRERVEDEKRKAEALHNLSPESAAAFTDLLQPADSKKAKR